MNAELTLSAYLEQWLETYARNAVGNKTFERYERIVRQNIVPQLGDIPLGELKPLQIQGLYSMLMTSGRQRSDGGLSALTVQHVHRLLRKALSQAVRWEVIERNPADGADPPRVHRKEMSALDREQLGRLLKLLRNHKLYIPVLLAATTGMRRGEIMALRWSDIDLDAGTLRVTRSLEQTGAGLNFKEPKSRHGKRTISLAQVTVEALRVHRAKRDTGPDGLVLSRFDGSPWPPNQLSAEFHKVARRGGFPIRFHDLRHTHASHLLRDGVPVNVVSRRLGHAEPSITLNVYSHVLPGMQEEAAAKIDEMMADVLGGAA